MTNKTDIAEIQRQYHTLKALNETALRRLDKIVIDESGKESSRFERSRVGTFLANLYSLGFTVNPGGINTLGYATGDSLKMVLDAVKEFVGAHVDHEVMYPNFPTQVIEAKESELLVNALVHYVTASENKTLLPKYQELARGQENLDPEVEVTVLEVANEQDLNELAKSLLLSSRPWSDVDKTDLKNLHEHVLNVLNDNPAVGSGIKVKENVATLLSLVPDADITGAVRSVVDVLRIATAMSVDAEGNSGDTSLSTNTKFKLSRPQRRLVLSLVEKQVPADGIGWTIEKASNEASLHREKFKRLGRAVHHREYAHQYPQASKFFDVVQSGLGRSVYSDVEKAIASGEIDGHYTPGFDVYGLVATLSAHPSIYARRLHEVIVKRGQRAENRNRIVYGFKAVAPKVSPAVLVQAWQLFSSADATVLPSKLITLKNGKSIMIPNSVKSDSWDDVVDAIEFGLKRNEHTSAWKNKIVHIVSDEENGDDIVDNAYVMPVGVRDVSASDRVIGRGSKVKLREQADTVRLFMHWKNTDDISYGYRSTVDLDLSATFYSEDFNETSSVWYGHLRTGRGENTLSVHSGDIVDAPEGASEFIDIRIDEALKKGWRYVLPSVLSYSGQKFADIPEAFAGVMLRNGLGEYGEIFDAHKVQTKYDLTKSATKSTPYLFDLKTRELVWVDASVTERNIVPVVQNVVESDTETEASLRSQINPYGNNVKTNKNALRAVAETVVHTEYMTAYDYISHVVGGGRIVHDIDTARDYEHAGFEVVTVSLDRAHEVLQFLSAP